MEKERVCEEDGVHKQWYEDAKKVDDIPELAAFAARMLDGYEHDYGTVCHAVAALAVAAAHLGAHAQGITGFQAGAVTWEFIKGFGAFGPGDEGPMRLVQYRNMLYPQYVSKFSNVISQDTWQYLQERAAALLSKGDKAHDAVRAHWQSIVDGDVPFGYTVEEKEEEQEPATA